MDLRAAGLDPERCRHLLQVRRREVELPAIIGVLGLELKLTRFRGARQAFN
jgi:hypothetical protein